MAHGEKSAYYQALKREGYAFDRHYREYTTDELREAWVQLAREKGLPEELDLPAPKDAPPPREDELAEVREQMAGLAEVVHKLAALVTSQPAAAAETRRTEPAEPKPLDPSEHAGIQLNSVQKDEVIEIDQYGNKWYQKEVRKPSYPKPRGRRVLRYEDPGVRTDQVKVGEYTEGFEVAGDPKNARPAEIKITLPSYQTGIYKAPNLPFKIHTYQGVRGFDLYDVQNYYGGADLVPSTIKKRYVATDLCYDITSTIRTIENEYRERVLGRPRMGA